jgi:hypothetical protein
MKKMSNSSGIGQQVSIVSSTRPLELKADENIMTLGGNLTISGEIKLITTGIYTTIL